MDRRAARGPRDTPPRSRGARKASGLLRVRVDRRCGRSPRDRGHVPSGVSRRDALRSHSTSAGRADRHRSGAHARALRGTPSNARPEGEPFRRRARRARSRRGVALAPGNRANRERRRKGRVSHAPHATPARRRTASLRASPLAASQPRRPARGDRSTARLRPRRGAHRVALASGDVRRRAPVAPGPARHRPLSRHLGRAPRHRRARASQHERQEGRRRSARAGRHRRLPAAGGGLDHPSRQSRPARAAPARPRSRRR